MAALIGWAAVGPGAAGNPGPRRVIPEGASRGRQRWDGGRRCRTGALPSARLTAERTAQHSQVGPGASAPVEELVPPPTPALQRSGGSRRRRAPQDPGERPREHGTAPLAQEGGLRERGSSPPRASGIPAAHCPTRGRGRDGAGCPPAPRGRARPGVAAGGSAPPLSRCQRRAPGPDPASRSRGSRGVTPRLPGVARAGEGGRTLSRRCRARRWCELEMCCLGNLS